MKKRVLLSLLVVVLISCVTINIYFPTAEVQKAAKEITEEVRGLKEKPPTKPPQSEDHSWLKDFLVKEAYAQEELAVSNASIRQLKARMRARYPKLRPYLARGILGESLDGKIILRNLGVLSLRQRAEVKRLIEAENRDREALYQEVRRVLGIAPKDIVRVRRIFAKEWQRTAPKGTWIETAPGKWVRK